MYHNLLNKKMFPVHIHKLHGVILNRILQIKRMRYIFVQKGSNHSHKNAKRQPIKRLTNYFHTNTSFSFFKAKTSIL